MDDIAYLLAVSGSVDSDGYLQDVVTSKQLVYARVKSVARSEFYKSLQAGISLSIAFDIRADSYNDEKLVEYKDKRYKVVRTYQKNADWMELNCSEVVR